MRIRKSNYYEVIEIAWKKAGFASLNHFAASIGEPKSSLSRYFNGQRQLPADTLVTVANALKLTPTKLLAMLGYEVRKR
jgi:transcriptional regulator with XRE-family HTH domain